MKILLLTNSADSTANLLLDIFDSRGFPVFRWNVDLWDMYEIKATPNKFLISDRKYHSIDLLAEDYRLLWRKPFLDQIPSEIANSTHVKAQFKAWLKTIEAFASSRDAKIFISPYSDEKVPKLLQLQLAKKYFLVPDYEFSVQSYELADSPVITKSISDALIGKNSLLFTTQVEPQKLFRPFPWFLQKSVVGKSDLTCVYINGESFWYRNSFVRSEANLDWRVEINQPNQSQWNLDSNISDTGISESVSKFMGDLALNYGRLDFIEDTNGDIWFLEVNPNGEFGWLDDESLTLHNKFADALLNY